MVKPVDYKQGDYKWGSLYYAVDGEKSTIKSAGCGPTSMADVLASIVSPYIDPITISSWARYHNYKVKNSGTSYNFFVACGKAYGVNVKRLNTTNVYGKPGNNIHIAAKNELQAGNWLIACMGKGNWTSSGHYVVAYGLDGDNVLINDCGSTKANRAKNSWALFTSQVKYYWAVEVPESVKKKGIVTSGEYKKEDFIREVQMALGANMDGIYGSQTLSCTVTVSKAKNRKHTVVLPLQKRLKYLGFYKDACDEIAGNNFNDATKSFQVIHVKMRNGDGEFTARGKSWKTILTI